MLEITPSVYFKLDILESMKLIRTLRAQASMVFWTLIWKIWNLLAIKDGLKVSASLYISKRVTFPACQQAVS